MYLNKHLIFQDNHNERIKDVPKILETPYIDGKAPYKEEIDMLKNQEFRNIE